MSISGSPMLVKGYPGSPVHEAAAAVKLGNAVSSNQTPGLNDKQPFHLLETLVEVCDDLFVNFVANKLELSEVASLAAASQCLLSAATHDSLWQQRFLATSWALAPGRLEGALVVKLWQQSGDLSGLSAPEIEEELASRGITVAEALEQHELYRACAAACHDDLPTRRGSWWRRLFLAGRWAEVVRYHLLGIRPWEGRVQRLFVGANADWSPNWTERVLQLSRNALSIFTHAVGEGGQLLACLNLMSLGVGDVAIPFPEGDPGVCASHCPQPEQEMKAYCFFLRGLDIQVLFAVDSQDERNAWVERINAVHKRCCLTSDFKQQLQSRLRARGYREDDVPQLLGSLRRLGVRLTIQEAKELGLA